MNEEEEKGKGNKRKMSEKKKGVLINWCLCTFPSFQINPSKEFRLHYLFEERGFRWLKEVLSNPILHHLFIKVSKVRFRYSLNSSIQLELMTLLMTWILKRYCILLLIITILWLMIVYLFWIMARRLSLLENVMLMNLLVSQ